MPWPVTRLAPSQKTLLSYVAALYFATQPWSMMTSDCAVNGNAPAVPSPPVLAHISVVLAPSSQTSRLATIRVCIRSLWPALPASQFQGEVEVIRMRAIGSNGSRRYTQ